MFETPGRKSSLKPPWDFGSAFVVVAAVLRPEDIFFLKSKGGAESERVLPPKRLGRVAK